LRAERTIIQERPGQTKSTPINGAHRTTELFSLMGYVSCVRLSPHFYDEPKTLVHPPMTEEGLCLSDYKERSCRVLDAVRSPHLP
jgi:hypothetical protein